MMLCCFSMICAIMLVTYTTALKSPLLSFHALGRNHTRPNLNAGSQSFISMDDMIKWQKEQNIKAEKQRRETSREAEKQRRDTAREARQYLDNHLEKTVGKHTDKLEKKLEKLRKEVHNGLAASNGHHEKLRKELHNGLAASNGHHEKLRKVLHNGLAEVKGDHKTIREELTQLGKVVASSAALLGEISRRLERVENELGVRRGTVVDPCTHPKPRNAFSLDRDSARSPSNVADCPRGRPRITWWRHIRRACGFIWGLVGGGSHDEERVQ
jgi:hypothetical protein